MFAREKVVIFLETTDDPNNLQWSILEYWKNMSFSDKLDFDKKLRLPTTHFPTAYV